MSTDAQPMYPIQPLPTPLETMEEPLALRLRLDFGDDVYFTPVLPLGSHAEVEQFVEHQCMPNSESQLARFPMADGTVMLVPNFALTNLLIMIEEVSLCEA